MKKMIMFAAVCFSILVGGYAVAGPINQCPVGTKIDDGKACTLDECFLFKGKPRVSHKVACPKGATCNKAGACEVIDLCKGVNIDDGKACTGDKCTVVDGKPVVTHWEACAEGAVCNENSACELISDLISQCTPECFVSIDYDKSTSKNRLTMIKATEATSIPLATFAFDTGYWSPMNFAVDQNAKKAYAVSSAGTLYGFDLQTGKITSGVKLDVSPHSLRSSANQLIAMSYNDGSKENEIRKLSPIDGTSQVIVSFAFDTGKYSSPTFTLDPKAEKAYAISSSDTLYSFDLQTGKVNSAAKLDVPLQVMRAFKNGLIAVAYNEESKKNELRMVNPSNGTSEVIASFTFDTGYWLSGLGTSFTIDPKENKAYVISSSNQLYSIDLNTGEVTTKVKLDQSPQVIETLN